MNGWMHTVLHAGYWMYSYIVTSDPNFHSFSAHSSSKLCVHVCSGSPVWSSHLMNMVLETIFSWKKRKTNKRKIIGFAGVLVWSLWLWWMSTYYKLSKYSKTLHLCISLCSSVRNIIMYYTIHLNKVFSLPSFW